MAQSEVLRRKGREREIVKFCDKNIHHIKVRKRTSETINYVLYILKKTMLIPPTTTLETIFSYHLPRVPLSTRNTAVQIRKIILTLTK